MYLTLEEQNILMKNFWSIHHYDNQNGVTCIQNMHTGYNIWADQGNEFQDKLNECLLAEKAITDKLVERAELVKMIQEARRTRKDKIRDCAYIVELPLTLEQYNRFLVLLGEFAVK